MKFKSSSLNLSTCGSTKLEIQNKKQILGKQFIVFMPRPSRSQKNSFNFTSDKWILKIKILKTNNKKQKSYNLEYLI